MCWKVSIYCLGEETSYWKCSIWNGFQFWQNSTWAFNVIGCMYCNYLPCVTAKSLMMLVSWSGTFQKACCSVNLSALASVLSNGSDSTLSVTGPLWVRILFIMYCIAQYMQSSDSISRTTMNSLCCKLMPRSLMKSLTAMILITTKF